MSKKKLGQNRPLQEIYKPAPNIKPEEIKSLMAIGILLLDPTTGKVYAGVHERAGHDGPSLRFFGGSARPEAGADVKKYCLLRLHNELEVDVYEEDAEKVVPLLLDLQNQEVGLKHSETGELLPPFPKYEMHGVLLARPELLENKEKLAEIYLDEDGRLASDKDLPFTHVDQIVFMKRVLFQLEHIQENGVPLEDVDSVIHGVQDATISQNSADLLSRLVQRPELTGDVGKVAEDGRVWTVATLERMHSAENDLGDIE